jgi:hypothetical protein
LQDAEGRRLKQLFPLVFGNPADRAPFAALKIQAASSGGWQRFVHAFSAR